MKWRSLLKGALKIGAVKVSIELTIRIVGALQSVVKLLKTLES